MGQTFTFQSESNPTTGYDWHAAVPNGPCAEALRVVNHAHAAHDPNLMGSGGWSLITFQATEKAQPGTVCDIAFGYIRPWEPSQGWEADSKNMLRVRID